jgi:predicted small lipoprotein YifL
MKNILLLISCLCLVSCGQAGKLYIPKPDKDMSKTDNANNTIRQDAWPR